MTIRINQIISRKENKTMDYEQFKERIEEDLHQALADHGIDVNLNQHHVEKPTRIYVKNFMDMESIRFAYLIGTAVLEIRKMNF